MPLEARGSPPDRGFTLFELLITVAMIGVLMGVVFLRLDGLLPTTRLKSNARELGSHLEQAFNFSVVSGRVVRFEYDLDERAYRFFHPFELDEDGVTIMGEGETSIRDWEYLSPSILIADVRIGDADAQSAGRVSIQFEPRGVCTGHVVHLMREESESFYSIEVSPLLGYVDVQKGYRNADVLDESEF